MPDSLPNRLRIAFAKSKHFNECYRMLNQKGIHVPKRVKDEIFDIIWEEIEALVAEAEARAKTSPPAPKPNPDLKPYKS